MNDDIIGSLLHDGTFRARWLREVLKTPQITDAVRVLLLTFGLHMDASGRVSVPREGLAGLLGRSPRKVADKVKASLASGFLVQTARGQKHQTAVYQAAIPGYLSRTPGGPAESDEDQGLSVTPGGPAEDSQGDGFKHPERDSQGDGFKHPENSDADLSVTPGGPAEDSQGDPRGSSHSYKGVEESEEVDLSASGRLFDLTSAAARRDAKKAEPKVAAKKNPKTSRRTPVAEEHPRFAEWYAAYPIHKAPGDARKAFTKAAAKVEDVAVLIDAATRYHHDPEYLRGYGKYPATWLNKECWLDEPTPQPSEGAQVHQLRPTGTDGRLSTSFAPGSGARAYTQTAEEIENAEVNL